MAVASGNQYSNDNQKFRRAYIRERLVALKQERDELVREREAIDVKLAAAKGPQAIESDLDLAPSVVAPSVVTPNAGSPIGVVGRFNGFGRKS